MSFTPSLVSTSAALETTATTASTTSTTGALISAGGLGVAKDAFIAGNIIASGGTYNTDLTAVSTGGLNIWQGLFLVKMDGYGIQATEDAGDATLNLNKLGGDISIGATTSADLIVNGTGRFNDLTDGKFPYHVSDAAGLADSPLSTDGTDVTATGKVNATNIKQSIVVACSDETTALTTGTSKLTFRMPYAMTLTEVRASATTAPVGSTLTVDINDGGTSIMTTHKLDILTTATIDDETVTLTDTALADKAIITIDIVTVGSTTAGAGLKVYLIGTL